MESATELAGNRRLLRGIRVLIREESPGSIGQWCQVMPWAAQADDKLQQRERPPVGYSVTNQVGWKGAAKRHLRQLATVCGRLNSNPEAKDQIGSH